MKAPASLPRLASRLSSVARVASLALLPVLVLPAGLAVSGCGGDDKAPAKAPEVAPSLDDALALLPGNPIMVGTVDARAFFGSQTFGADLAKLVEKYTPFGQEAGFQASRDVDRVTFASYSYQGIDVAAIAIGRFDGAKIKAFAASQAPTKSGAPLVVSSYAGREVYTVSNVGFTLLSDTRAVVGTESGIRRVLERIADRRVKREMLPWMISTVETSGAAFSVAADFASQPMPAEAIRQVPAPIVNGLKAVRAVGMFKDGVQIAGSITYGDTAGAEAAAEHVKKAASMSRLLAFVGIQIKTFDTKVEKSDVQVTVALDDQSLRQLVASVPAMLGQ